MLDRLFSLIYNREHTEKAVNHPVITGTDDRNACLGQTAGKSLALVPEGVILGGNYQGRRQPAQVGGLLGRGVGIGSVGVTSQIMVPIPDHSVPAQLVAFGIFNIGHGIEIPLGDRVHQQLEDQGTAAPVAGHQGYGRGQVAAGAVSAGSYPGWVHIEGRGVGREPLSSGIAVLRRAGELGLRSQPVINGNHHAVGADGQIARGGIG